MKARTKKRIVVSVTNDLVSDNRVHKVCTTLSGMGFHVLLAGRTGPSFLPLAPRSYVTRRFRLLFNKGMFFYACFNLRLFLFLLFSRFDVLLANDLDTLPANFLASRIKCKPLIYDSHEYFTEAPELVHRPHIQRFWQWLEGKLVPGVNGAYTVCDSIARVYTAQYGVPFRVVRNVPRFVRRGEKGEKEPGSEKRMLLYQGAVNIHRGLEQVIQAMKFVEGAQLVIAGDGDIRRDLEKLVQEQGLGEKVFFRGRLPLEELRQLTNQADLGLSVEEDVGLNYRYALPNKLFDYIQARVPVLVTRLPEMEAIVNHYQIGQIVDSLEPNLLAKALTTGLFDNKSRREWIPNLEKAAADLIWENEERVLMEIFKPFRK